MKLVTGLLLIILSTAFISGDRILIHITKESKTILHVTITNIGPQGPMWTIGEVEVEISFKIDSILKNEIPGKPASSFLYRNHMGIKSLKLDTIPFRVNKEYILFIDSYHDENNIRPYYMLTDDWMGWRDYSERLEWRVGDILKGNDW